MPFNKKRFSFTALDKAALDPDTGCYADIGLWAKIYLDAEIFPWQKYFYHHPAKFKQVAAGIRTGKSKGIAFDFLHYGMYHPNSKLLNTSISSEQAKIIYNDMMELLSDDRISHWVEHTERSPYPFIQLVNGTEFWFRSIGFEAELIRGQEFDWINGDEFGYVKSDVTVATLKGRLLGVNPKTHLPRAGIFTMVSSPKGKTGPFYENWKKGDPRFPHAQPDRFLSLRVKTMDNPLLSPDMLAEIMADYTDKMIAQELNGEFLDDDGAEFDLEQIMHCCYEGHAEVKDIVKQVDEWREKKGKKGQYVTIRRELGISEDIDYFELDPLPGKQYIASWDLGKKATKSGRNATVGMVWDITELPWRMVGYRYETNKSYLSALGWIEEWHIKYSSRGTNCYTVIDASGKGDVLNEIIEAENRIQVDGIVYSNVLKPNLITSGKLAIERDMVRFYPIRRMIDQLSVYTQLDKDLAQDIVMAFCQAMHKAREITGVATTHVTHDASHVYRRNHIGSSSLTQRYAERRRASIHLRSGRTTR